MNETAERINALEEEEVREQARVERERIEMIEALEQYEGWQAFLKLLQGQITERREAMEMTVPDGMDGMINREFMRGEIVGMRFACEYLNRVKQAAKDAKVLLDERVIQLDKEREARKDLSNGE